MSRVILTKWGNSLGIRIPSSILKEAHLSLGEELSVSLNKKGGITLVPVNNPQEGWLEAFNAIAEKNNLLADLSNEFDEEEWTW